MSTPYLEISFRHGRPFAAYIHCGGAGLAAATSDLGHGLLMDRSADGRIIGVEITDPAHTQVDLVVRILGQHGIDLPASDLAPLAA